MTVTEMIDVMTAHAEGYEIESRRKDQQGRWDLARHPTWNFYWFDYRKKVRPSMTPTEINKVVLAFKAGKLIEFQTVDGNDRWEITARPVWDFLRCRYRVHKTIVLSGIMTPTQISKVTQAYEAGKSIESRPKYSAIWTPCPEPVWDFPNHHYRVAPKTRKKSK